MKGVEIWHQTTGLSPSHHIPCLEQQQLHRSMVVAKGWRIWNVMVYLSMFLSALKDEKIQKKHISSYRKSWRKWEFYIFFSSSVNDRPRFLLHKIEIKPQYSSWPCYPMHILKFWSEQNGRIYRGNTKERKPKDFLSRKELWGVEVARPDLIHWPLSSTSIWLDLRGEL